MTLPRIRQSCHVKPIKKTEMVWEALKAKDLKGLSDKIKLKFQWTTNTPKDFQIMGIEAQLKRQDVLVHARTGTGKTLIAAGPHAHERMAGKVTIMISPLIGLQEEQVYYQLPELLKLTNFSYK